MIRAPHRNPRLHRAGESGIALIAAVAILLIVSLLATAAVTVAFDTAGSTTHDEQRKAAMAAAEAGLRVATYRLTMLNPESTKCINASEVVAPAPSGYCEAGTESIGNGASFDYATSPVLKAGEKCVGLAVSLKSETEGIAQRCVTASGMVHGISQRAQARVASFTAIPIFPKPGVIGKKEVKLKGNSTIEGAIASNGKIHAESKSQQIGSGELHTCELGPSGKIERPEGSTVCGEGVKERTPEEGEIVITSLQPGEATHFSAGPLCPTGPEEVPTGNCDFRIENGIYNSTLKAKEALREPYDLVSGNVKLEGSQTTDPTLTMAGNSSITLGGGVYYFCSLTSTGNASLTVATGTKTEIFIGSPECPGGKGTLNFTGNFNNASNDPTALQIYIYGEGTATLSGNAKSTASLVGPEAAISVSGNFEFEGGIAANTVALEGNSRFKWNEADKFLEKGKAKTVTAYYRTSWSQCTPEGTTPAVGC